VAYYSFVVVAPHPVGIIKPMLLLDSGMNAFSIAVDDLDALLERFKEEGVVVQQRNCLDEFEPTQQADLLLEGEVTPPLLEGHPDGVET
jgi:hypothetical protein